MDYQTDSNTCCLQLSFSVEIEYPFSDTYDIDNYLRNNASQTEAIRAALTGRFTLIQGPPGKYFFNRDKTAFSEAHLTFMVLNNHSSSVLQR